MLSRRLLTLILVLFIIVTVFEYAAQPASAGMSLSKDRQFGIFGSGALSGNAVNIELSRTTVIQQNEVPVGK